MATPTGRLILTLLGGIAQFERYLIRERTAEGRARARKAGARFGAKPKMGPVQRDRSSSGDRRESRAGWPASIA
jgi:DNA invertase Pin-like site-specific DNA recombinase